MENITIDMIKGWQHPTEGYSDFNGSLNEGKNSVIRMDDGYYAIVRSCADGRKIVAVAARRNDSRNPNQKYCPAWIYQHDLGFAATLNKVMRCDRMISPDFDLDEIERARKLMEIT